MCCQKAVQTLDPDTRLDICLEVSLLNWKRPLDCFVIKGRKTIFSFLFLKFNMEIVCLPPSYKYFEDTHAGSIWKISERMTAFVAMNEGFKLLHFYFWWYTSCTSKTILGLLGKLQKKLKYFSSPAPVAFLSGRQQQVLESHKAPHVNVIASDCLGKCQGAHHS